MRKATLAAVHAHAVAQYPRESCGLIVAAGRRGWLWPNDCPDGSG